MNDNKNVDQPQSAPLDELGLARMVNLDDFEAAARRQMSPMAYEYVAGGVADDITLAENRRAFERIRLLPRHLIDVSHIDTSVQLFGRTHVFPILLAPTGYHKLVHPAGELETVEGANQSDATLVASIFSTVSFERMNASSKRPLWFQLYIQNDRALTKDIVQTVLSAGCEAICLTVDSPVNGPRDRETRAGFALPPGVERANLSMLGSAIAGAAHRPAGRRIYNGLHAADVVWRDLDWLRSIVPIPLLLKGVAHPDDADLAVRAGCDGLIVSNHGARTVDTVPASIDLLPAVVNRVAGRIPILFDGGIRRGTDIFKALALGASATLIGRSYLYGLAVGHAGGIHRVIEILRTELEMTMGMMGTPSLSAITTKSIF